MWSAILLVCLSEGLCQASIDPRVHPTEEMCHLSVQVGAKHFYEQGWVVADFRCINWRDKDEEA